MAVDPDCSCPSEQTSGLILFLFRSRPSRLRSVAAVLKWRLGTILAKFMSRVSNESHDITIIKDNTADPSSFQDIRSVCSIDCANSPIADRRWSIASRSFTVP